MRANGIENGWVPEDLLHGFRISKIDDKLGMHVK